jgi:hypothetical protein
MLYVSKHRANKSEHPVWSCVERRRWCEQESRQQRMQSNWFLERFSIGSCGSLLAAATEEKGHFAGLISFIFATSSMSPRLFYSWNCFSYVNKRTVFLSRPPATFPVCTGWNWSCPRLFVARSESGRAPSKSHYMIIASFLSRWHIHNTVSLEQ